MHLITSTLRSHLSLVLRAAVVVMIAGVVAACDRHPAEEAPENYGHGSSHERLTPDHQLDSKEGSHSFSDTAGTKEEAAEEAHRAPAGSPSPAPGGHF